MIREEDESLDRLVRAALEEDVGPGDVTTEWSVPPGRTGRARIVARESGVASGVHAAVRAFRILDDDLAVEPWVEEGGEVSAGEAVLEVAGRLRPILTAERTALNFLARLSGIASLTRRYVRAVEGTGCAVTDTRKTTPGWRRLEKAATRAGGAVNHRFGLFDMVLVKENHARAAGGIGPALELVLPAAREHGVEVEVEVDRLEQLEEALAGRPDRILLDNMSPGTLSRAVERVADAGEPRPLLEASGGVTLDSIRDVAGTGVDFVSVGALTHSAPALDLSLLVDRVEDR